MVNGLRLLPLVVGFLVTPVAALAQTEGSLLPDGVTSLQEVYQDWRVNCTQGQPVLCTMSQEQTQNGQRVLAIELTAGGDAGASGTLILPFGLELSAGAIFQVDDGAPDSARSFKTCFPGGCTVRIAFDQARLEELGLGTALKVDVVAADNGQPISFGISLKGFRTALARTAALSQ